MNQKEYKRQYYLKNREKILAKVKKWYQENKERKLAYDKEYYKKNKEYVDEKKREYRKDNPEIYLKILRRNRAKNPEGDRARHILNYHVEKGKITKPCECEIDGCDRIDVQAHHEDYSEPLNVAWVCAKHHHEIHRKVS